MRASLDRFYDYFRKLNSKIGTGDNQENTYLNENDNINEEINRPIEDAKILKVVQNLKNNKSPGNDQILNEHIKATKDVMLPIFRKLFNLILDVGIIPQS